MDQQDKLEKTSFFVQEFISWLWYRSENHLPILPSDPREIDIDIKDRITLGDILNPGDRSTIQSANPTEMAEAKIALQMGKLITEARLHVATRDKEWLVTVSGPDFKLKGIKLPELLTMSDEEKVFERLALLEELTALMDELYLHFIGLRTDPERWNKELRDISRWINGTN